jgi:putative colanic acid biosynthesis glycosyltransferase
MNQSSSPLFSLVTVTLHNLDGLRKTHESLKIQDFKDFEWIVVDGGSTDGTLEYLQSTGAIWASEKDAGIYDAMNKGLRRARGQYVWFLNAGDRLTNADTLGHVQAEAVRGADFIYGDSLETYGAGGEVFYKTARLHSQINRGMFTHHQAMIYRRNIMANISYSQLYNIAGDYDFTARFLQLAKNVVYVPRPLCVFEAGGVSQQKAYEGRREQFIIRQNLGMVSEAENVRLFLMQSLAWHVRRVLPGLYRVNKKPALR